MNESLVNPHLPGEPFYWAGGSTGILLVHGFTATTAEVRLLAERLRGQGFTISAPLLPGHGVEPEDLNRVRWLDWYLEVEKAYAQLKENCSRVFAAGESTGGLLALMSAARHKEIAGVMAYAPAFKLAMPWSRQLQMRLLAPFKSSVPKSGPFGDVWQGYSVYPLKGAVELLRLQGELRVLLKDIRQPILVIQGKLDQTVSPDVPAEIMERVRSRIKELYWMENSGHCVILDVELDRITELTLAFIERALKEAK